MDGYEIPVHKSVCEPFLLAGAPREITLGLISLGMMFLIPLQSIYGAAMIGALHPVVVYITKDDPDFFKLLKRHLKLKKFYEA